MSGITDHLEIELREAHEAGAEIDHLLQAARRVYGDTALREAAASMPARRAYGDTAFEDCDADELLITWTIDSEGSTPAEAAVRTWRSFFDTSGIQPSNERACTFTVQYAGRTAFIDLAEPRFAHLFESSDDTLDLQNIENQTPVQTAPDDAPAPTQIQGVILDADSVRAEILEAPASHLLNPQQAQALLQIPDETINAMLYERIDDRFWNLYDEIRRDAITLLRENLFESSDDTTQE